jgi:tol-pal system protein YbgF
MALTAPLFACATEAASKAAVDDLRAEVHALRESNARLEQRIDRLEGVASVRAPRPAPGLPADVRAIPDLTVIKLKPRTDPAPRIDTEVAVVEPTPEIVQELTPPKRSKADDEGPSVDPALAENDYTQGVAELRTGNVEGGITRLLTFASSNPRNPKADNALYFAGLGQMGLQDYRAAATTFQRLLEEHPAGDAVQDGMLRLAECRVRLNQVKDAKAIYSRVVSTYPGTAAASQAEERLASLR